MRPEQEAISAVVNANRIHVRAPDFETKDALATLKHMVWKAAAQGEGFKRLMAQGHLWMRMEKGVLRILDQNEELDEFEETPYYDVGGKAKQKSCGKQSTRTGARASMTPKEASVASNPSSGSAWKFAAIADWVKCLPAHRSDYESARGPDATISVGSGKTSEGQ
ncbi:hypothetical protein QFC20_002613 [Naganishia adeliensis]|uniref:Uncharacterized protein n=1 Tax=Naganishia adeliensis TaxID=92952 RepID=A0ACC2WI55_9TREE|nr:hypothetical protein QFC20_002613 [Naganishia adeliensis]